VTLMALLGIWGLTFVVCAVCCAIASLVGQRLDDAETRLSRRQWKLMCEALDLTDLPTGEWDRATAPTGTPPESDLAALGVHRAGE
jgi:apolipoprotein N-acyltransferase